MTPWHCGWVAGLHRLRLSLLVDHVRKWFKEHGKNPDDFELAQPPRKVEKRPTVLSSNSHLISDTSQRLRERLKRIIDRMSLEQLHQIRIPAEYLDD